MKKKLENITWWKTAAIAIIIAVGLVTIGNWFGFLPATYMFYAGISVMATLWMFFRIRSKRVKGYGYVVIYWLFLLYTWIGWFCPISFDSAVILTMCFAFISPPLWWTLKIAT